MKLDIKNRLRESFIEEELLDEAINAGSFQVYHRTRANPKDFNKGFKPGGGVGGMYGYALYTTYDLASQLKPNMASNYGQNLVEFNINNNGNFVILDAAEASKAFGPKFGLFDQLKSIMKGKYLAFYKANKVELDKCQQMLAEGLKFTSEVAIRLSKMTNFINYVDGMVFTGSNDGMVLVLYDTNLANPIRYTSNNGETWNSMKDIEAHKIGRDRRSGNKIMTQLRKGFNINFNLDDLLKEPNFIENLNTDDLDGLINGINRGKNVKDDTNELFNLILNNETFMSKLSPNNLRYIITSYVNIANDGSEILKMLNEKELLINILDTEKLKIIIDYAFQYFNIGDPLLQSFMGNLISRHPDILNGLDGKHLVKLMAKKININGKPLIEYLLSDATFLDSLNVDRIVSIIGLNNNPNKIEMLDRLLTDKVIAKLDYRQLRALFVFNNDTKPIDETLVDRLMTNNNFLNNIDFLSAYILLCQIPSDSEYGTKLLNLMSTTTDNVAEGHLETIINSRRSSSNGPTQMSNYSAIISAILKNNNLRANINYRDANGIFSNGDIALKKTVLNTTFPDPSKNYINKILIWSGHVDKYIHYLDKTNLMNMLQSLYNSTDLFEFLLHIVNKSLLHNIIDLIDDRKLLESFFVWLNFTVNSDYDLDDYNTENSDINLVNQANNLTTYIANRYKDNKYFIDEVNTDDSGNIKKGLIYFLEMSDFKDNLMLELCGEESNNAHVLNFRRAKNPDRLIEKYISIHQKDGNRPIYTDNMSELFKYTNNFDSLFKMLGDKSLNLLGPNILDTLFMLNRGDDNPSNRYGENRVNEFLITLFKQDIPPTLKALTKTNIVKHQNDTTDRYKFKISQDVMDMLTDGIMERHIVLWCGGKDSNEILDWDVESEYKTKEQVKQEAMPRSSMSLSGTNLVLIFSYVPKQDMSRSEVRIGMRAIAREGFDKTFKYIHSELDGKLIDAIAFDEDGNIKTPLKESISREEQYESLLLERDFDGEMGTTLTTDEKNDLYKLFKASYEKSVGTAWDYGKFINRISTWTLYGNSDGFITVRPQRSGLIKLTGSAGNPRGILRGLDLLVATNKPIWGVVTPDIAQILKKKGFIIPNPIFIKILFKLIPSNVLGGHISLNNDGSLNVTNSDTGSLDKIFVANKLYLKSLLVNKDIEAKLPTVIKLWVKSL